MEFEVIPGFHALEFKEQAQARVQAELEGLSPEERLQHIRKSVEQGPFGDLWQRMQEKESEDSRQGTGTETTRSR